MHIINMLKAKYVNRLYEMKASLTYFNNILKVLIRIKEIIVQQTAEKIWPFVCGWLSNG